MIKARTALDKPKAIYPCQVPSRSPMTNSVERSRNGNAPKRLPRIPRCPIDAPNAVYTAYDASAKALYIGGTTREVNVRLREHERAREPWVPLTRTVVRSCLGSEEALWFVEKLKIAAECLSFNERDKPAACSTDLGLRELLGPDYYR